MRELVSFRQLVDPSTTSFDCSVSLLFGPLCVGDFLLGLLDGLPVEGVNLDAELSQRTWWRDPSASALRVEADATQHGSHEFRLESAEARVRDGHEESQHVAHVVAARGERLRSTLDQVQRTQDPAIDVL